MDEKQALLVASEICLRRPEGVGWLLDHVSLQVPPGVTLALQGASGSGKTLLLRTLALLDPIQAGQIQFRGETIERQDIPHYRSQVIYAHQTPRLLAGNVEEALRRPFDLGVYRRRSFNRERLLNYLNALGLSTAFFKKRVSELSGGETQLVALLRVLQLDPCILLLDEPTSALDIGATLIVESLIRDWLGEDPATRATIWVTHSLEQAERVASQVIRMNRGKISDGK